MLFVPVSPRTLAAQQWTLQVPEPASAPRVVRDVRFATADTLGLKMDVYRPVDDAPAPALVFYTLFWPGEGAPLRTEDWYRSWGRLTAANGIVAIIPDLRAQPGTGNASGPARALGRDFEQLLAHLVEHADDYGIDPRRIAVFAASGAAWAATEAVQDPRVTTVKAAVVYYGGTNVQTFRTDLPLMWVRAGRDSEGINSSIASAVARALAQNVPLTLVNHATGPHAFEGRDGSEATRHILQQTFEFVRNATSLEYQASLRPGASGGRAPTPP